MQIQLGLSEMLVGSGIIVKFVTLIHRLLIVLEVAKKIF